MDCTGPWHSDWQLFRGLFQQASEEESNGTSNGPRPFPGFRADLFGEAYRLYKSPGGKEEGARWVTYGGFLEELWQL